MEETLAQFFVWWDGPDGKEQAVREQESVYRIAQRAFAAGHAARYEASYAPSRDALTAPRPEPYDIRLTGPVTVTPPAQTETGRVFHVSTATIPDARTYNPGELSVADIFQMQQDARRSPPEPDPLAKVRLTGPQQAAMDRLFPLPMPPATQRVWDGEFHAPATMPMRVIPADMPVRGPTEPLDWRH